MDDDFEDDDFEDNFEDDDFEDEFADPWEQGFFDGAVGTIAFTSQYLSDDQLNCALGAALVTMQDDHDMFLVYDKFEERLDLLLTHPEADEELRVFAMRCRKLKRQRPSRN